MSQQSAIITTTNFELPQLTQASVADHELQIANESGTNTLDKVLAPPFAKSSPEVLEMLQAQARLLSLKAGWLDGTLVRQVPTRNFNARPQHEISLIVIHCIALPPKQYGGKYVDHLFTNCLDPKVHPYFETIYKAELSSHLFINRLGQITQYVSFLDRAWHAGRSSYFGQLECNDYGIGIELEGADDDVYTAEQYVVLNEVIKLLQRTYPDIQDRIASHSEIAPQRKTDPGPFFDYGKIGYPQHHAEA